MRTVPSGSQHEPLITPEEWQGGERRFAIRLSQLLDEIYRRLTALETKVKALEANHAHD